MTIYLLPLGVSGIGPIQSIPTWHQTFGWVTIGWRPPVDFCSFLLFFWHFSHVSTYILLWNKKYSLRLFQILMNMILGQGNVCSYSSYRMWAYVWLHICGQTRPVILARNHVSGPVEPHVCCIVDGRHDPLASIRIFDHKPLLNHSSNLWSCYKLKICEVNYKLIVSYVKLMLKARIVYIAILTGKCCMMASLLF